MDINKNKTRDVNKKKVEEEKISLQNRVTVLESRKFSTIYVGNTEPVAELGDNGDLYIQQDT